MDQHFSAVDCAGLLRRQRLAIFLLRQFFKNIPMEMDEAARIDGAGYWRIFFTILLPLCARRSWPWQFWAF
ncbi:MAG: ABC transporter permease subunit [Caldilineaceae bacterium]